jgi:hypothetical protein
MRKRGVNAKRSGYGAPLLLDQLSREPSGGGDTDLLTEDCAYGDLKSIPSTRSTETRTLCD